jgi:hypothetical protein
MKNDWLLYVTLAGLSWGTYVPLIFYGGNELGGKPGARLMAILCVFSGLAGIAGAVGAICVIFASKAAMAAGLEAKKLDPSINPAIYRMYIAPLIFGLAPVINTLVSSFWHPKPGQPFHFEADLPGWKLWVGILLVGAGAALVLFSKEEAEEAKKQSALNKPTPSATASPGPG